MSWPKDGETVMMYCFLRVCCYHFLLGGTSKWPAGKMDKSEGGDRSSGHSIQHQKSQTPNQAPDVSILHLCVVKFHLI